MESGRSHRPRPSPSTARLGAAVSALFLLAVPAFSLSADAPGPTRSEVAGPAGEPSPLDAIRARFPTVAPRLESGAVLEQTQWRDGLHAIQGLRAGSDGAAPSVDGARARVIFPASASEPVVAEGEGVRVVLEPVGARPAPARVRGGLVGYARLYPHTDAVHVVADGWTEEYLHLRGPDAPRRFEYDVVVTGGASRAFVENGQVRFVDDAGRGLVILAPVVIDAAGRRSATAAHWELGNDPERGTSRLTLLLDPEGLDYPLLVDPTWITTGSLNTATYVSTGILLHDNTVLVFAGSALFADMSELYDPSRGIWTPVGPVGPTGARENPATVMLRDGRVLVIGGVLLAGRTNDCRIYDPLTRTWSAAGAMITARSYHTATLLRDGRVLVAGGLDASGVETNLVEIYDPASDIWSAGPPLLTARGSHTATLLRDGTVMVTGGRTTGAVITGATEVFDPGGGGWTSVSSMGVVRTLHTATMLPDGRVLVAGGVDSATTDTGTAELFNPGSGTWTPTATGIPEPRHGHSATLLPSGSVLVAGGADVGSTLASSRLYDPVADMWSNGPDLAFARHNHASTMLPDGRVLMTGGQYGPSLATAELFDNDKPSWAATTNMSTSRWDATATLLLDGRVLVAGGESLDTAAVYDPAGPSWTAAPNLSTRRWRHSATLLQDGRVLVVGSRANTSSGKSAEIYNPGTNTWTTTVPDMPSDRNAHTATLLPCGEVLIVGGSDSGSGSTLYLSVLRLNPITNMWRTTTPLSDARFGAAATLLPDGRVLVSGGYNGTIILNTATIYDPVAETWAPVANTMKAARYLHTSTLLPSGKVLLVGGGTSAASAEVFDPATGMFTSTAGNPAFPRDFDFTSTLLPNGRVLVVGGSQALVNEQKAEVYDPVVDGFTAVPDPLLPRWAHSTSLLLDGRVLVVGGVNAGTTPELYDVGRGEQAGWRPFLDPVTGPIAGGVPLGVSGTGFQGLGEGSTGLGSTQSATNYPLVQLRRLDNEEVRFLPLEPTVGWTSTSFQSRPIGAWSDGPALVTVFTNGIPSVSATTTVECPAPAIVGPPVDQDICLGGSATFTVSATGGCSPQYQWRKGGAPIADGGVFSGTQTDTLQVAGALAGDAGSYDVVVAAACSSFTATSPAALLTVSSSLSAATASIAGPSDACQTCTGGTASESHTGGGPVTHQWGYRTVTAGPITPIIGQTGPTYVLNGADFPDVGTYYVVVTVTPLCGAPVVSSEEIVQVTSDPPLSDSVQFFTVTSRSGLNVLEWVNAAGRDTVRIRYNAGTPCVYPGDPMSSGVLLTDQTGPIGGRDAFTHTPIANGTTYCYTMWTDLGGSYSAGRSNHGRPFDTTGAAKWAFSTGVFSITAPTVGPTSVIATSNDTALHATERGPTGGLWPPGWIPIPIGEPVQSRSPIVPIDVGTGPSNPVIYLGSQDGAVYVVDGVLGGAAPYPGSLPWPPAGIAGTIQGAPAGMFTAFGGAFDYLLIGTRDGGVDNALVALNPLTGAYIDQYKPAGMGVINGTATVDYATRRVFFTSRAAGNPNTLWCLQLDASPNPTFTLLWARALGDIDSSPVLRGDRVYVGTTAAGGTLYSIDAATGAVGLDRTWPHGDGPVRGFVWPDRLSDDLYFASGTLVHGVSDTTGGIVANFAPISLGALVTPSPVLFAPGTQWVYVGGSDGKLYEIDVTGPTVKSVTLGDGMAVVGAPSLDRVWDLIHVGTEAGIFYAVQIPLP